MTSVVSWQNPVSLCPISFCTLRSNLPVTPGVSWLPIFAFQYPMLKRASFFLVLVLEWVVGLHRTVQFQLLLHQWLGIDLDYCDVEWFALKMNRDHSVFQLRENCFTEFCCFCQTSLWIIHRYIYVLTLYSSAIFQNLLVTVRATPFLLRDSCPQ